MGHMLQKQGALEQAVAVFGRLKTYTYGASPMPLPLLRAAMAAWPQTDFIQVYGLTEVAGVATHLMPDEHRDSAASHPERLVSAGRPIPRMELRIVDPVTLEEMPVGQHGEIWLRTPQLMLGFLGKPEATAEVVRDDGWFRTGDIGRLDDQGFLTIVDRKKDIIIRGGENISSKEVEDVLATHPAVFESAVTAMPDPAMGEKVCAFVVLREGRSLTLDDVRAHFVAVGVAKQKTPERIIPLPELPRTAAGKVKKFELRGHFKDPARA